MHDPLITERRGAIAVLTIDRPESAHAGTTTARPAEFAFI